MFHLHRGLGPGQHGLQADGAEGHAAAIPGNRQLYLGTTVRPAVEDQFQGDFIMAELGVLKFPGENKPHFIEAAPGVAGAVFNIGIRQGAEFRHPPGAQQQIGAPALVPEGWVIGILHQAQGLFRALINTVKRFIFTLKPLAAIAQGAAQKGVAGPGMDAIRADLHATAALGALFFVAHHSVLAQRIFKPAAGILRF